MFDELDVVRLRYAMTAENIPAGAEGTIVHVFSEPQVTYEVEFCDDDGQTLALLPLKDDQVDLAWSVRTGRRILPRAA